MQCFCELFVSFSENKDLILPVLPERQGCLFFDGVEILKALQSEVIQK